MELSNKIAERNIIGILMRHPDWIMSIKDLRYEYFDDTTNRIIFYTIRKMYDSYKGSSFEPFILLSSIKDENIVFEEQIEKSGGVEYLETLKELSEDYTIDDLKQQANIVVTLSYMRDTLEQNNKINDYIRNGEQKTIQKINQFAENKQREVTERYTIQDNYTVIGDVVDDTLEELKKNVKDGIVGYPSKIGELNEYMTYRKGELVIIGARAKGELLSA